MKPILVATLIVAVLGGGGWFWWSKQHAKPAEAVEPEQPPVSVINSKLAELHQTLDAERDALLARHAEKRYAALVEYATKNPDAPDVSNALEELVDTADELFRSKDVVQWTDLLAVKKPPHRVLVHAQLLAAEALGRLGRLDDAVARFTPIESDVDPNLAVDAMLRHAELLVNMREFKAAKALYKECGDRFHEKALSEHLDECKDELDRIGEEAPALDVNAIDGTTMSIGQDPLKSKVVLVEF